jgi:hypothetical protein
MHLTKLLRKISSYARMQGKSLLEPILKKIDYSLGGYSHRERWSRTRQKFQFLRVIKKAKEDCPVYVIH